MPETACATITDGERVNDIEISLNHWNKNHLCQTGAGFYNKFCLTAIPARNKHLTLIIRVD